MAEPHTEHPAPHVMSDTHEAPHDHRLHMLMLGTALVAGAVILSPYVLPALGIGTGTAVMDAIYSMHAAGAGTGLVGAITAGLGAIPLIGKTLAAGGLASGAVSAATGIGGVLTGNFLEKKENGKSGIKWGKVIKYGALLTSALIAMPSVLTGMSIGLVYLAAAFGTAKLTAAAITLLSSTIGTMASTGAGASIGLNGAAAALPHLLTCGAALLPTAFSFGLADEKTTAAKANDSILAKLEVDRPTAAGLPVTAKLRLTDARTGLPVIDDELAVTHMRKLHLYVTDQSLKEYHHIHPQPTGEPGVFGFSFTPTTSNRYDAWADFTLIKDGGNHRIKIAIPSAVKRDIPAIVRTNTEAEKDGLVFHWKISAPLQKNATAIAQVEVTDRQGNPVTDLEPVMGAFAHLAGFSADGKHFIHTHPLGMEPAGPDARGGPVLRFQLEPEHAGPTQFYLQVRRGGKEVHVPFGQQITLPEQSYAKIYGSNRPAMQMAV